MKTSLNIRIEKRLAASKTNNIIIRVLFTILSFPFIGIWFAIYGVNPLDAYIKIFIGGFGSSYGLSETIVKMLPIGLCAVGLAIAYKARVLNIGAEGQLIMGSITTTWVALYSNVPPGLAVSVMLLAGFIAGAAWAIIPALLKTKLGVNEVIVTLMMNYISLSILNYVVTGPWRGEAQWGFPQTDLFPSYARLPTLAGTRIHYHTLAILLASTILLYILIYKTTIGYEIKLVGNNPDAARYAGISLSKTILLVMVLSGGLAGIAGVGEVAGIQGRLIRGISPGYGYTAIIPAWLGGLDPLATLAASFFISGLMVGGDNIQVSLRLPSGLVYLFNGTILLFVISGEFLTRYKVVLQVGERRIWI
ncbi:MAG: ABC transporter permease [Crenarchaeota archaeon]|nr:ABC transporter permease [Thermoproteota archaeon]MDW8033638.1 ABC transporter permease [Nitrososphaerota archaeon]